MFLYKHFVNPGVSDEAEDVVRNLGHIFAARRGTGYFLQSFGLTGPGRRQGDELLVKLIDEIQENLRLYEPRVEIIGKIREVHDNSGAGAKVIATMRCHVSQDIIRVTANVSTHQVTFEILPPGAIKGVAT